jgi:cytochrome c biogenesis protein CcdA
MLSLFFLLLFIEVAYSSEQVILEFLYWDPHSYCDTCPSLNRLYQDFLAKNKTMNRIWGDYKDKVVFKWIDITSEEGMEKKQLYSISHLYAIVINGKLVSQGDDFNETYIREAIEAVLKECSPPAQPSKPLMPILASAFLFGFFETFSPCLIALLAFILSYTVGNTTGFKDSILQVMVFGIGFVFAAVSIGLTIGLMFLSLQAFQIFLMWIICIFAIFFGFNLLGLFKTPFETKPLVKKLVRKNAFTYGGLILLGFIFYFLDPCLAPIFVAMLPLLSPEALPIILLVFCLGVILPFCFIGTLAGSISRLARDTYRHKAKIRAVSGLILLAYALYIILFYLI